MMTSPGSTTTKKRMLKSLPHLAASAVIMLHAFNMADEHPWAFMVYPAIALVLVPAAFIFRYRKRKLSWPYFPVVILFVEGALAALVLIDHVHEGRKYLPYVDAAVVVICCVFGVLAIGEARKAGDRI